MRFDIVTLFPTIFDSFFSESIIGKALAKGAFEVKVINVRDFTTDRHGTADDRPFGGGPGMVLKPEPLSAAIQATLNPTFNGSRKTIFLSPAGRPLTQKKVEELASLEQLVLVCGRYEGVDERVTSIMVDEEISVGDYVLSGGEVPAMLLIEAVARLLPGVLGKFESTAEETFTQGLLEYPQFTRPRVFEGLEVPDVLLSGDHEKIRRWRLEESIRRTMNRRPDLLDEDCLTTEAKEILSRIRQEYLDFLSTED